MGNITDNEGRNVEFFIDNFRYVSIATADFSPAEDPSPFSATDAANMLARGFFVMPHADGNFYGITWRDYHANKDSLTGVIPSLYKGLDATWIPVRFVKVFASNDSDYPTIATTINYSIPA
jgi:hypothetical protein